MIGHVTGNMLFKDERVIIVRVGGVGYTLSVTPATALNMKEGEEISLWTHLVVKEDALDLYGFNTRDEIALFRLLIGISGIGPKSALSVLALADVTTLATAIATGESAYMTKVSGIGKKLADKIILELRDKMGNITQREGNIALPETEALEALEALGYTPKDTRELVRMLAKESMTTQDIIRKALQTLGGRK